MYGVLSAELHSPVHLGFNPLSTKPTHHQANKTQPVNHAELVTVRQEPEPRLPLEKRPPIARKPAFAQVIPKFRSQSPFVHNVLGVYLGQVERLLFSPGPRGLLFFLLNGGGDV